LFRGGGKIFQKREGNFLRKKYPGELSEVGVRNPVYEYQSLRV